jgi:hypothetical protein
MNDHKVRKSKFTSEEERQNARTQALKKAAYKYQKKEEYKDYKKAKYREHVIKLIYTYLEKKQIVDNAWLTDEALTTKELRLKFKKKYGEAAYDKYLFKK